MAYRLLIPLFLTAAVLNWGHSPAKAGVISYTTISVPGAIDTVPTSISSNQVAGWYRDSNSVIRGFTYDGRTGTYATLPLHSPSGTRTIATGVQALDPNAGLGPSRAVGLYSSTPAAPIAPGVGTAGFYWDGATYTNLIPPGTIVQSVATAIWGDDIVGYNSASTPQGTVRNGFAYDGATNTYSSFAVPGANQTTPTSIAGSAIAGYSSTSTGQTTGFLYDTSSSTFTAIAPPSGTFVAPAPLTATNIPIAARESFGHGLDFFGQTAVGTYRDSAGSTHGFVYDRVSGEYTTLDPFNYGEFGSASVANGVWDDQLYGRRVVGGVEANSGMLGYMYNGSTYTALNPTGANWSVAIAIDAGNIVGLFSTDGGLTFKGFYTFIPPPGSSFDNPLLPTGIGSNGEFVFENVRSGQWFDPPLVDSFTYEMTSGSLFTSILDFPPGFASPFDVLVEGSLLGTFGPGQSVDLVSLLGAGVSRFTIAGIAPLVDSDDPQAFPLQLAFNTSTASFTMTPVIRSESVPEPLSLWLWSFGGAVLLGSRVRRQG